MKMVLVRITTRYLAGALVAYGLLEPDLAAELVLDPDMALIMGAIFASVTEFTYGLAHRYGWAR